jgi:CheY-like chemotaxis protein
VKNILVVDDQKNVRFILTELFEEMGYRTQEASDGLDALEKLQNDSFDLVISDLSMPRMDGFSLLETIKTDMPDMPCVIITGYTNNVICDRVKDLGADAFLRKPFTVDEMSHLISGLIATTSL